MLRLLQIQISLASRVTWVKSLPLERYSGVPRKLHDLVHTPALWTIVKSDTLKEQESPALLWQPRPTFVARAHLAMPPALSPNLTSSSLTGTPPPRPLRLLAVVD